MQKKPELTITKVDEALNKLTFKQKKWVREYLKTGNGSEASRLAYNTKHPGYFSSRNQKNPKIREAIGYILEDQGLSNESLAAALKEEIFYKPSTTPQERSVRINAIKLALSIKNNKSDDSLDMNIELDSYEKKKLNENKN